MTHLDDAVPSWHFREIHRKRIDASPERIFAAIKAVTPNEIRFFRTLTAIRRFGRPLAPSILNAPPDEPLLSMATRTTFFYVADDPPREVVVATNIGPNVFAAMNFLLTGRELSTETRVVAKTTRARIGFGLYWIAIRAGSGLIRHMWLRAIKRRAEARPTFDIRKATLDDVASIEEVMARSLTGIGSRSYDARQIASSLRHVAHLDLDLVRDRTYFVAVEGGKIVGCGGWSRRAKLYAGSAAAGDESRLLDPASEPARVRAMFVTPEWERKGIGRLILGLCEQEAREEGFRKVELMAMLSGEAMYTACGYRAVERVAPPLEDGTPLPLTRMEKSLG